MQRLSDTRWPRRVVACRNVGDGLYALIYMLEDLAENYDCALDAQCLLSLIDFNFVLMLNLFCNLLSKIHGVSMQLQSPTIYLSVAAHLVHSLTATLKDAIAR